MHPLRLTANLAFVFVSEIMLRVVSATLLILVSRTLGPGPTGVYSIGTTLLFVGSRFSLWGLDQILIRDVAVDRSQAGRYFSNFLFLRIVLSGAMGFIITTLVLWVLPYAPASRLPLLIILWGLLPENITDICRAAFLALERAEYIFWVNCLTALFKVSGAVLVMWLGYGLGGIAWAVSGGGILGAFCALVLLLRRVPMAWFRPDFAFWWAMLKEGMPFWAINLSNILDSQADLLFLPWFVSEVQVGLYGAGLGVFLALGVLPTTFRMAVFPRIMQLFTTDQAALEQLYRRSLKYLIAIAVQISVGLFLVADQVIHLLYRDAFAEATSVLQVMVWSLVFLLPGDVNSRLMVASRNQRLSAGYTMVGLTINVIAILFLVPRVGILGAAWARVASNMVVSLLNHLYVQRWIVQANLLGLLWRPLLAVSIMGMVVGYTKRSELLLSIISGFIVYVALIITLGAFTKPEMLAILGWKSSNGHQDNVT